MTKHIKALCLERGINQQELAKILDTPQSNLSKKYLKDNWKESDLEEIASKLNAKFKGTFVLNEDGKEV